MRSLYKIPLENDLYLLSSVKFSCWVSKNGETSAGITQTEYEEAYQIALKREYVTEQYIDYNYAIQFRLTKLGQGMMTLLQ